MERFETVNGIHLHYVDHGGEGPLLLLMPGLTANARSFDGLVKRGLNRKFRVVAVDLRGRGLSDKPPVGYTLEDHAEDISQLIGKLTAEPVILGGHSFGGLLSLYLAVRNPEKVSRLVVIDAAAAMHPRTRDLIQPAIDRLDQIYPSWEAYLESVRRFPCFDNWWDPAIERYFRADVETASDGSVSPRSSKTAIETAVGAVLSEPWMTHLPNIRQPLLLINGTGGFGPPGAPPILPAEQARETVAGVPRGTYRPVVGNHMTMLYGEGAAQSVSAIEAFAFPVSDQPRPDRG